MGFRNRNDDLFFKNRHPIDIIALRLHRRHSWYALQFQICSLTLSVCLRQLHLHYRLNRQRRPHDFDKLDSWLPLRVRYNVREHSWMCGVEFRQCNWRSGGEGGFAS